MQHSLSRKEAQAFRETVERIGDERVRYFYMMLGDALAEALNARRLPPAGDANTGPMLISDIQKRLDTARPARPVGTAGHGTGQPHARIVR